MKGIYIALQCLSNAFLVSFDDEFWCFKRLGDYPSGLINVTTPPETNPTEPPETNPTEPPETNPTEPPETNPTEPPETNPTEPPETNPTEPPETNPTEPPETNPTEPPMTNPTEPPVTEGPPITNPTESPSNSTNSTNIQPASSPEPTSAGTIPSSNLLLMLCIIALIRVYNKF